MNETVNHQSRIETNFRFHPSIRTLIDNLKKRTVLKFNCFAYCDDDNTFHIFF